MNSEGHPVTVTSRPASPAEIAAAAANLDGAEVGWIGDTSVYELFDYVPDQYSEVIDVSKMWRVLVIPLPDKETT